MIKFNKIVQYVKVFLTHCVQLEFVNTPRYARLAFNVTKTLVIYSRICTLEKYNYDILRHFLTSLQNYTHAEVKQKRN